LRTLLIAMPVYTLVDLGGVATRYGIAVRAALRAAVREAGAAAAVGAAARGAVS
jgi:hypothetical protein